MILLRSIKCFPKYLCHQARHYLSNGNVRSGINTTSSVTQTQNINDNKDHIVWLDMEMTGLEVEYCHILEIACLITNKYLMPIDDCLNIVIYQPNKILENMSDWCKVQHKKTGLIDECQSSKITLQQAEEKTLQYLSSYIPKNMCPLAGNSIYMDRMFLRKYMPLVNDYLHYRNIDISSIKELTRRWQPDINKTIPKKRYFHRAIFDLQDSLNELHYYKKHFCAKKENIKFDI